MGLLGKENFIVLKMHSGVFCELKSSVCKRYYQQYFIQNVRYVRCAELFQLYALVLCGELLPFSYC